MKAGQAILIEDFLEMSKSWLDFYSKGTAMELEYKVHGMLMSPEHYVIGLK